MALSDLIKKIEDSPRSTKVAVCSVAFGVAAGTFALYTIVNQPERIPEPASAPKLAAGTSSNAQAVPAPAAPQPTPPPVPTEIPSPIPTSTLVPSPTPKPSGTAAERPTPNPTATRAPVATPTPEVNDYYVVIQTGTERRDNFGGISFHAEYPEGRSAGFTLLLKKDDDFLEYLVRQNVIDSEQKNAYSEGKEIFIPMKDISNAVNKLIQNEGAYILREYFNHDIIARHHLTYHADPIPPDSATRAPVATPTPEVNDYYVYITTGSELRDGRGGISFYAEYPEGKVIGFTMGYKNDDDFLSYLVRQKVIDSEQKNAYSEGKVISIPIKDISNSVSKMIQNEGLSSLRKYFSSDHARHLLTYHADPIPPDSNENAADDKSFSEDDDRGYVVIQAGKISVSGTDDQGNTNTVSVEGESAQALIDRWLKSNKITVEQRDAYGRTGQLEFSLEDGVDLFDLEYSANGGLYIGIDEEDQSKIKNILELFSSE